MNRSVTAVLLVMSCVVLRLTGSVTDAQIKIAIIRSGQFIDNSDLASRTFDQAEACCEGDTNRFARILFELSQTNNVRIADRMIRCLGWYGTPAQLPFLYSMATNAQHGVSAVKSILRLEGVTSNSLAVVDSCLSTKSIKEPERLGVCRMLVDLAYVDATPSNVQERVLSYVYGHARTCDYPAGLDQTLIRHDPGYRQSQRRLSILRDVFVHGVDQWDVGYVTNAINELVAYPEANLPE